MLRRTACWLSSLVLLLWVVLGSCEYPAQPSGGPTPEALSTMLFFPCPTGDWFDCHTADQEARAMIAEAISGYWGNPHNLDACDRARTEILGRVNCRQPH